MIEKFKKKIKKFVDVRVNLIKDQQRINEQVSFDFNQISKLFNHETFIPLSSWAISPSTILHILNDISINKKQSIIEFGSGASTFYIAQLIKTHNLDAKFFSVESDENWAQELHNQIKLYELEDFVKIIYAPMKEVKTEFRHKQQNLWYDMDILENVFNSEKKFDLVVVDGPYGGSTPFARYSAVPFLQNKLAENYAIFLDDINRPQEKEIFYEWQRQLRVEGAFYHRYAVLSNKKGFDVHPFQLFNIRY